MMGHLERAKSFVLSPHHKPGHRGAMRRLGSLRALGCGFLLLISLCFTARAETDYQNYIKAAYCIAVIDTSLKNAKTDPPLLMSLYEFSPDGQTLLKHKRKRYQSYLYNNQTEDKEKEKNLANSRYTASENGKFDLMMCKNYTAGFCQVLMKTSERYEKCVTKRQECQRVLDCFEVRAPF